MAQPKSWDFEVEVGYDEATPERVRRMFALILMDSNSRGRSLSVDEATLRVKNLTRNQHERDHRVQIWVAAADNRKDLS